MDAYAIHITQPPWLMQVIVLASLTDMTESMESPDGLAKHAKRINVFNKSGSTSKADLFRSHAARLLSSPTSLLAYISSTCTTSNILHTLTECVQGSRHDSRILVATCKWLSTISYCNHGPSYFYICRKDVPRKWPPWHIMLEFEQMSIVWAGNV